MQYKIYNLISIILMTTKLTTVQTDFINTVNLCRKLFDLNHILEGRSELK